MPSNILGILGGQRFHWREGVKVKYLPSGLLTKGKIFHIDSHPLGCLKSHRRVKMPQLTPGLPLSRDIASHSSHCDAWVWNGLEWRLHRGILGGQRFHWREGVKVKYLPSGLLTKGKIFHIDSHPLGCLKSHRRVKMPQLTPGLPLS